MILYFIDRHLKINDFTKKGCSLSKQPKPKILNLFTNIYLIATSFTIPSCPAAFKASL